MIFYASDNIFLHMSFNNAFFYEFKLLNFKNLEDTH
jgi:hypothetical protein